MITIPGTDSLVEAGASQTQADAIRRTLQSASSQRDRGDVWHELTTSALTPAVPFPVHQLLFRIVFEDWDESQGPPPAWRPTPAQVDRSNIAAFCGRTGRRSLSDLYDWSVGHRGEFWGHVVDALGIHFQRKPVTVLDDSGGPENARWFPGARLNIADSCFRAPAERTAIVAHAEALAPRSVTYGELDHLSARVAASLRARGLAAGDPVALVTPMTVEAVAAYLGVMKAGCVAVSIAESFTTVEIATRVRIAGARTAFTRDASAGGGRGESSARKLADAGIERVIVLPAGDGAAIEPAPTPRDGDCRWQDFLVADATVDSVEMDGDAAANILFSSGTTGQPKAIPWTHTTPIKCAMDGYLHHDIQPGDVVAWPTNLGWMMGPWLIFATFINGATMALYDGPPASRQFCRFVQDAGVTVLGLVPSIVRAWKAMDAPHGMDWSRIRAFSSTGEPSNPTDYLYLMSLAGYRPVIEYCGGTEIGGGYLCGTVVQPASPSTFTTPAFGLSVHIMGEDGEPADTGELYLVPPSVGLSNRLVNMDHHSVYYRGVPRGPGGEALRRHGDEVHALPGRYYRALGRADDTMNLSGVKVSTAEIEGAVAETEGVGETAAVAVPPPGGGPSRLVIYAVPTPGADPDRFALRMAMQRAIATRLNPQFKVHDVVVVDHLPRTASNKVMRRVLRQRYPAEIA